MDIENTRFSPCLCQQYDADVHISRKIKILIDDNYIIIIFLGRRNQIRQREERQQRRRQRRRQQQQQEQVVVQWAHGVDCQAKIWRGCVEPCFEAQRALLLQMQQPQITLRIGQRVGIALKFRIRMYFLLW